MLNKIRGFQVIKIVSASLIINMSSPLVYADNIPSQNRCKEEARGDVIFVNVSAAGRNDGSSWSNAYIDLKPALKQARLSQGPDQIWIAKGEYMSGRGGYILPSDVQLFGGFSGKEEDLIQHVISRNKTILFGGNNTNHVIYSDNSNVMIDGLTVTGGHATGDLTRDALGVNNEVRGGGMLLLNSRVIICNSVFVDNHAKKFGGAIFQQNGMLEVVNSRFEDNSVLRGELEIHDTDVEANTDGGAIAIFDANSLVVSESVFLNNIAGDDAGAISTRKTNVEIFDSQFVRNRGIATVLPVFLSPGDSPLDLLVTGMGGAIQIWNEYLGFNNGDQGYRTIIKSSSFIENRSVIAGAVYIETPPGSKTVLDDNKFIRNGGDGEINPHAPVNEQLSAYGRGAGALMVVGLRWGDQERDADGRWLREINKVNISNSLFEENEGAYGGGVQLLTVDADVTNSFFIDNIGRQRGGAIWSHNTVSLFDQLGGLEPGIGGTNIENSMFISNKASGLSESLSEENFPGIISPFEPSFGGGAIANEALSYATITDSTFIGNESRNSDGGAIHNVSVSIDVFGSLSPPVPTTYGATLEVSNSLFWGNRTVGEGAGGAIANGGAQSNGKITDSAGEDVRVKADGGMLKIDKTSFKSNTAAGIGGALINWSNSSANIQDSVFTHNTAKNGGALASYGVIGAFAISEISDSNFLGNNANVGNGGAIYSIKSELLLKSNSFRKNYPEDIEQQ